MQATYCPLDTANEYVSITQPIFAHEKAKNGADRTPLREIFCVSNLTEGKGEDGSRLPCSNPVTNQHLIYGCVH